MKFYNKTNMNSTTVIALPSPSMHNHLPNPSLSWAKTRCPLAVHAGRLDIGGGGWEAETRQEAGVKYRMLHIPGILDYTYHLHVSVSVCSRF